MKTITAIDLSVLPVLTAARFGETPYNTLWDGQRELPAGVPWPTHYMRGDGAAKPTQPARYAIGSEVQRKQSDGIRTVRAMHVYQMRWYAPEPVYVLDDGSYAFDYHLH